jgi:hypothetical protein
MARAHDVGELEELRLPRPGDKIGCRQLPSLMCNAVDSGWIACTAQYVSAALGSTEEDHMSRREITVF